ncbi:hypothetical protein AYJ54_24655 [Bradyrhizobium centrolobii]|uniref:Uncharacterized protein n=2 Tax=Bradyrhizobium TaxID=374 RepID=A0A176Z0J4_9BRAD|nr:hypothetical protein AYJ54_24655 [Bradyrhizobium centrolobii]OAF12537.1 hypothetical protein AXW67_20045 [Bradyrhizobium neotropicale]
MTPLVIEDNALGVQRAQITGDCKQDFVEYLKRLIQALLSQQRLRKTDRSIDIARFLLQRVAQSLLVDVSTDGARNAFAHSWIDIPGAEQLWGRRLLY